MQELYKGNPQFFTKKFTIERDKDTIFMNKKYSDINNIINTRILEVAKLQDKILLDKLTTEELKRLKKLINEILKERK